MFKGVPQTSANQEGFNDFESKYKVAEILSSMQSTSGFTPTTSGIPFSNTVVSTGITPVFTPTSFANLEQTIASLTQQQVNTNVAVSRESGFVPPSIISEASVTPPMPVMVQVKSEVDYDTDQSSLGSESDYGASSAKRARFSERSAKITIPDIDPTTYLVSNSRRPTGPRRIKKDENLTQEEIEKRQMRRERNKRAAAKCRQRREDVTNQLIVETESLEEERNQLENEIHKLRQQKEQYEFLLDAHRNSCQFKPQNQQPLNLAPPKTTSTMTAFEAAQLASRPQAAASTLTSTARPTTLPIVSVSQQPTTSTATAAAITQALGIPITTPSSVIFGFDTLAGGHTGLTPLTGMPSSSISTPTSQSCSGQVQSAQRKSTDSSSSNELSSPTTLMAL